MPRPSRDLDREREQAEYGFDQWLKANGRPNTKLRPRPPDVIEPPGLSVHEEQLNLTQAPVRVRKICGRCGGKGYVGDTVSRHFPFCQDCDGEGTVTFTRDMTEAEKKTFERVKRSESK